MHECVDDVSNVYHDVHHSSSEAFASYMYKLHRLANLPLYVSRLLIPSLQRCCTKRCTCSPTLFPFLRMSDSRPIHSSLCSSPAAILGCVVLNVSQYMQELPMHRAGHCTLHCHCIKVWYIEDYIDSSIQHVLLLTYALCTRFYSVQGVVNATTV